MTIKKRRQSKIKPRKPIDKPRQFCMDIVYKNKENLQKKRDIITSFVNNIYTNKKRSDHFEDGELFVVFDKIENRICIELHRKINPNYIKLEDIHKKLKLTHLQIDDNISLSKPYADTHKHHLSIDNKDKVSVPTGLKWATLSHQGPYFTWIIEPYKPHGIPILYDGKKYKLTSKEEEVANFWARRITTDQKATIVHTTDPIFIKNFWKDFKTYLTPEHKKIMKDFNKFNFENIRKKLIDIKENETEYKKKDKKRISAETTKEYGFAVVNGVKEKIAGYVPEPASLFLGRGKNPLRGRIKRDVKPSDVIINIGIKSKTPKAPQGHWKKVVLNPQ